MRVPPYVVAAGCSLVAATALVISEGALSGVHAPHIGAAGSAPASGGANGSGSVPQNQSSSAPNSGVDQSAAPQDAQTGEQSGDQSMAGDNSQPAQSGSGGVDPGSVTQILPLPPAIP
ncbi:MAG TPA: hypothetical protein VNA65_05435 [Candidatus Dormibacteraeota bacterium]|nr:hypothetical protein [Candidatus Dormibacteraeota bacterium]